MSSASASVVLMAAALSMSGVDGAFVAPSAPVARAAPLQGIMDAGIGPETGGQMFDPAGFTKFTDDRYIGWLRAAEIKHSRVAMLATFGWILQENGGGLIKYHDAAGALVTLPNNPIEALKSMPNGGFFQIVFTIGCIELWHETQKPHYMSGGTPGLVFNPFNVEPSLDAQNKELKNGRLAMWGIMSFFAAEFVPGSVPGYPF